MDFATIRQVSQSQRSKTAPQGKPATRAFQRNVAMPECKRYVNETPQRSKQEFATIIRGIDARTAQSVVNRTPDQHA